MTLLRNPYREHGLPAVAGLADGRIESDPAGARRLLELCPSAGRTELRQSADLAGDFDVGSVLVKDERARMNMGSFKALGAAYAVARLAADRAGGPDCLARLPQRERILEDMVFACASAGNHGLSLAIGARLFGARAVVYLAAPVPEAFAARLRCSGAEVRRAGRDYEAAMGAAEADCGRRGWTLLSDSSWPGYIELPKRVMEGYLVVADEVAEQVAAPPTHVFLQAGVGGFAAAMTAYFRRCWGDLPTIVVVEPDAAPALFRSIEAGRPVKAPGPVSAMGRLDCKLPSHLALGELAREADFFCTISDRQCLATVERLHRLGMATTPSGAAGLAALEHVHDDREAIGLGGESRVLAFLTEGPEVT